MRLAARIALPCLLGAVACYSASDEGDGAGSGGSGTGGSSTGGKASGGSSTGGKASAGSSTGGTSSEGGTTAGGSGGSSTGGTSSEGGTTAGGSGGVPECEQVACLRPYECVLECGGDILYLGCCPCEEPTFDSFVECASGGGGSR